jgi:hypothetical protein
MAQNQIRRMRRMAVIAVVLCVSNCLRYLNNPSMRTVEMLSFVALGMSIGALVASVAVGGRVRTSATDL